MTDREKILTEIERLKNVYNPSDKSFGPEAIWIRKINYELCIHMERFIQSLPAENTDRPKLCRDFKPGPQNEQCFGYEKGVVR